MMLERPVDSQAPEAEGNSERNERVFDPACAIDTDHPYL
jgi:hypothetical protein